MPLMTWNDDEFSLHIKMIDTHHKKLFELINTLHDAMVRGEGHQVLEVIFSELIDYTVYHFRAEEALFDRYGYPHAAQHKKVHEDLVNKVRSLKERFDKNPTSIVLTMETMVFLNNWLKVHICGTDKKYESFLTGRGVT